MMPCWRSTRRVTPRLSAYSWSTSRASESVVVGMLLSSVRVEWAAGTMRSMVDGSPPEAMWWDSQARPTLQKNANGAGSPPLEDPAPLADRQQFLPL